MIKTILAWITGKSDTKVADAPYKVETITSMPVGTEAVMATPEQRYVGESEQGAIYEQVVVVPTAVVSEAIVTAPTVEVTPVTVKAKYKRADLTKMTKAELMELVTKHGLEVKARATKEEIVKVLVKV